jgi:hypothetical protein
MELPDGYQYWAFISYSHADAAWAQWLHHELETYRVPKTLERVMYFTHCYGYLEVEWTRHPGVGRDPAPGDCLDASFRWHDRCRVSTGCQCSRVQNTL